ncbi:MAG TPA: glycosyltransferase family 2 protein [Vicinamibacterales bacterium]|nr:glycosyltransferase family 2 protein [Vicinamibacterales bacterium]
MTPSELDIIVVSYNTRADLLACMESLHSHRPRDLGRIIVVDNASSDGSVDAVRAGWPSVDVVALDRNAGFAAANNAGFERTTAPLVLLLNSDTIVPPLSIDRLVDRLLASGATAAGPKLVDGEGWPELSYGPMLTPVAEFQQRRRVRRASRRDAAARVVVEQLVSGEREVDWVSGACLLTKRDAAVEAGLLDERYFMYEEDVDFCAALRARGGRILFTPVSTVTHLGGRSVRAAGAGPSHYDHSHVAFYEKHHPTWAPWLRLWLRLRGRAIR